MRSPAPLAGPALAAVAGIVCAEFSPVTAAAWLVIFPLLALVWSALATRRLSHAAFGASLVVCGAGFAALHALRSEASTAQQLARELETPVIAKVTGTVILDSSAAEPPHNLTILTHKITTAKFTYAQPVRLSLRWHKPDPPVYGQRISLIGKLENIPPTPNPAQFDYAKQLQRSGIRSRIKNVIQFEVDAAESRVANFLPTVAADLRSWIQERIEKDLEDAPKVHGVIRSIVLGQKQALDQETLTNFRQTGTMHLFAVSGLHVSMLTFIGWQLLRLLRMPVAINALLMIVLVVTYAAVTGMRPPVVRASVMTILVLISLMVERRPMLLNSVSAAALILLAWNTNNLFLTGFQLSFLVVLTIIMLAPLIQNALLRWSQPDEFIPNALRGRAFKIYNKWRRWMAGYLAVCLAAWIGSLPLSVWHFNLFSPVAVFVNLLAIGFAFFVVALAFGSILISLVWGFGGILFNNSNWLAAQALLAIVEAAITVPGGHVYISRDFFKPQPELRFTIFNLDGGVANFLRTRETAAFIDIGHQEDYRRVLLPFMQRQGVNHISHLILTHNDSQHIGAAERMIGRHNVEEIFVPAAGYKKISRRLPENIEIEQLSSGDQLLLDEGIKIEILYPPENLNDRRSDHHALVLMVFCAGYRILLMPESGFLMERWIMENGNNIDCDVLVAGLAENDHWLQTSFVRKTGARVAIIGSAPFAEDRQALLERLQHLPVKVMDQEETGAVMIEIDDQKMKVRAWKSGENFILR